MLNKLWIWQYNNILIYLMSGTVIFNLNMTVPDIKSIILVLNFTLQRSLCMWCIIGPTGWYNIQNKISYMSCLPKHVIFSHFLHTSGRGLNEICTKFCPMHVQTPNFRLVIVHTVFMHKDALLLIINQQCGLMQSDCPMCAKHYFV